VTHRTSARRKSIPRLCAFAGHGVDAPFGARRRAPAGLPLQVVERPDHQNWRVRLPVPGEIAGEDEAVRVTNVTVKPSGWSNAHQRRRWGRGRERAQRNQLEDGEVHAAPPRDGVRRAHRDERRSGTLKAAVERADARGMGSS
jgi:hypothetical protein